METELSTLSIAGQCVRMPGLKSRHVMCQAENSIVVCHYIILSQSSGLKMTKELWSYEVLGGNYATTAKFPVSKN